MSERAPSSSAMTGSPGQYVEWITRIEGDPRDRMLVEFAQLLPAGARVLDLGCGPGVPSTRALAQRFDVELAMALWRARRDSDAR